MPPDLDVTVGIDVAAAEEGLRRLTNVFHREIRAIDRSKAEAKVGADITKFQKDIVRVKREILTLQEEKADPEVELDDGEFKREMARLRLELKQLSQDKAEIQVDASQLKDANRQAALSVKRQEAMAKQTIKLRQAEEKLRRERERTITQAYRENDAYEKQRFELTKLREAYGKLAAEEDRLANRTGRPLGIFRSPEEIRRLERVRGEMEMLRHRIISLDGSITDINPDLERGDSMLVRWAKSLSDVRLHLGFFSANLKQLAAGLVILGPPLTGLLGSATSLVGVLGTGLAGAAAVGTAGLAGLALAAVGAVTVIKPIVGEIGEATKAAEAYHKAVLKYGKGSEEAAGYQEKLANTLKGISPGARKAITSISSLKERWRELTSEARKPVFEAAAESIDTVRTLMPAFARESVHGIQIVTDAWDRWMARLRSGGAKAGVETIFTNLNRGLPHLLDGFEHLANIIGRVTVSASKFLPSLSQGFEDWAAGLDAAVDRGDALDKDVGRLIGHMRDLGHLSQATGRLLIALFNTSADSGDGLVETLTDLFNGWADWMNSVEGQHALRKFFAEAAEESKTLFAFLGRIIGLLFQLGRVTAPVSDALFKLLNAAASILDAATDIGALNAVVKTTAKVMATLWAVNKVRAFVTEVRAAATALGLLSAAEGAAAAGGGVAAAGAGAAGGAAAGRAAAGGVAGGIVSGLKRIKWGKIGAVGLGLGLLNGVVEEINTNGKKKSDDIVEAFRAKVDTRSLFEKGTGISLPDWLNPTLNKLNESPAEKAIKTLLPTMEEVLSTRTKIGKEQERTLRAAAREADLTEAQKEQVQEIFRLARLGRGLHIRIGAGMSPAELHQMLHGFKLLRSGALTSLGDIGKITQQNAALIRNTLPRGSDEARRKMVDNFQAAARAVKKGMDNGSISIQQGTKRWKELLRNARLFEGRDPLGLAKGFAASWKQAGGINQRNRERIIDELRKMPPQARKEAFQMMLHYGRGLVRGKRIPEQDLKDFKSRALTELDGISGGFGGLSGAVYAALKNIGDNMANALKNMGGSAPHFSLKVLSLASAYHHMREKTQSGFGHPPVEKQQGGFTVPGYGSGDRVPAALPYGSFVMNREASSAYGLNRGGAVQTILEPKERVFLPHEVQRIGPERLEAMNRAVPRQQGGPIGLKRGGGAGGLGPMPQVEGLDSPARTIGRTAVQKVYSAAEDYIERHRPKLPAGAAAYGPMGSGPVWDNIREAIGLGSQFGLSVSSLRRPGDSDSYHSGLGGHQAVDLSNGTNTPGEHQFFRAALKQFGVRNILEMFFDPMGFFVDNYATHPGAIGGHSDHVHIAFNQGGFALSSGGPTPPPGGELVGASYYGGPTDHTSGTVGSSGVSLPGKMAFAELAMGKALGGLPYHTKLKIGYNGKSVVAEKLDIGLGGDDVNGKNRAIDLWYETANAIGMPGTAVVKVSPASGSAVGGATGGGAKTHQLPKTVKVKHPVYEARQGKGGGTEAHLTKKTVTSQVPIDIPDFGPIPNDEGAVKRELAELSHKMLPEYRAAYKQNKEHKQVAEHLKRSLQKIEQRIRALRDKLRELRYAKAKKRFGKKVARQLGRLTGWEGHIDAARRDYEEKNEYAAQVVSQEPEQPGELTEDWIEKVFQPYVDLQESPAYAAVLDSENRWRNVTLTAEEVAKGIEHNWEAMIGYPEKGRKPNLGNPDLHFPPRRGGGASGLADWIYGLHDQIERIRAFAQSHSPKWWSEHPHARERRDRELREIDTWFKPQLDYSLFRRKTLVGALGEGRESFNWFAGTGSFEESLQDVQGLHWPEQHEKLPGLPPTPVPGQFGGAIWDTQETIKELGLKVQQAKEQLEGTQGEPDRAAEIASFEEAIRGLLAGRPFISINQGPQFMGAFAKGGVALVGERGPELAHLPHGTRIHDAKETQQLLEPNVVVDLSRLSYLPGGGSSGAPIGGKVINVEQTNYFPTPPPDPHTWAKGQVFELEAIA